MEGINKLWKRYGQFIKFALVGCSNTVINLVTYWLCIYFGMHYILAYTCGFFVSVCNAFYWNNKYTFKDKLENSTLRAFIKAIVSYGISFVLSIFLMSFFVEVLKISSYIAPLAKMILTMPLNFILNKVWAFKDGKSINIAADSEAVGSMEDLNERR